MAAAAWCPGAGMKLDTLDDLFELELRELYDEERRLVDALPKLAHDSASERLRKAFEEHLLQTNSHVRSLEECFRDLGRKVEPGTSTGMKGLGAHQRR
jgi:ferritin-like metal-binding protein YciE